MYRYARIFPNLVPTVPPAVSKSVLYLPVGKLLIPRLLDVPAPHRIGHLATADIVTLHNVLTHSTVQFCLGAGAVIATARTPQKTTDVHSEGRGGGGGRGEIPSTTRNGTYIQL